MIVVADHKFTIFLLLALCVTSNVAQILSYDIVVYGATPAGIAAAIAATDSGRYRVAIVEAAYNFGGMSVAGGIGLRDIGDTATFNGTGLEWALLNAKYYKVDYPVWQPDMFVADATLKSMLQKYPTIEIFYDHALYEGPDNVHKDGTTIISITTGTPPALTTWVAKVFIDASYEGDLARWGKASFTYGRESRAEYNEEYAGVRAKYTSWGNFLSTYPVSATYSNGTLLPFVNPGPLAPEGSADDKMMGYSYRVCLTAKEDNKAPFPKPDGYNPADYVLLQRYIESLVSSGHYPKGPPFGFVVDILSYRNYPPGDKFDMCDSQSAFTTDVVNLNAGYVTGTYAQRKEIETKHYNYIAGLLTYLSTDPNVPEYTRNSTLRFGLCKDQWPENNHWPKQMYVREGLRIIGDNVYTQNDLVGGKCTNNSIGVGSWGIDIHVVQRIAVTDADGKTLVADNEGQMMTGIYGSGVYELPYTLLLPKRSEITNLLVPVCNSATHVSYASIRVEPTFMQLGQAAGVAASIALEQKVAVHDVPIKDLQSILLEQGINLHWPRDHCANFTY